MCQRILIVEKSRSLADSLALLVESLGHEVRIARDGQAALIVAERFHPEVILVDRAVSDLDGYPIATALLSVLDCTTLRIDTLRCRLQAVSMTTIFVRNAPDLTGIDSCYQPA